MSSTRQQESKREKKKHGPLYGPINKSNQRNISFSRRISTTLKNYNDEKYEIFFPSSSLVLSSENIISSILEFLCGHRSQSKTLFFSVLWFSFRSVDTYTYTENKNDAVPCKTIDCRRFVHLNIRFEQTKKKRILWKILSRTLS